MNWHGAATKLQGVHERGWLITYICRCRLTPPSNVPGTDPPGPGLERLPAINGSTLNEKSSRILRMCTQGSQLQRSAVLLLWNTPHQYTSCRGFNAPRCNIF